MEAKPVNSDKPKSKKKRETVAVKPNPDDRKSGRKSRSKSKKKDSNDVAPTASSSKLKEESRQSRRRSKARSLSHPIQAPLAPAPSRQEILMAEDDFQPDLPVPSEIESEPKPPPELTNEELCREVMEEFRQEAWDICMERLMFEDGHRMAVFELRDTWLRIMEAEWMDDARVDQSTLPASFFVGNQDEPPLPMSFDFWSKGILETLPDSRRNSVMDPFIHNLEDKKVASRRKSFETVGGGDAILMDEGSNSNQDLTSTPSDAKVKPNRKLSSRPSETALNDTPSRTLVPSIINSTMNAISSSEMVKERSSDITVLKPVVSITSSSSIQYKQLGVKPWTVAECGGKDGTGGVYRLIHQTTSEAIGNGTKKDSPAAEDGNLQDEIENQVNGEGLENDFEPIEEINPTDNDTEILYENHQGEEADGTIESISRVPSNTELMNVGEKNSPKPAEHKLKPPNERLQRDENQFLENRVGRNVPKSQNPKGVLKLDSKYQHKMKPKSYSGFSTKNIEEGKQLMKEKLEMDKTRKNIVQRHRNSVRQRISHD